MNEKLLQFIWQYSLYHPVGLQSVQGEAITILHPGRRNTDSGPDFTDARIKIGKTTLAGNVELHLKTSGWKAHGHHTDEAYKTVLLHVVYEHDTNEADHLLPLLELKNNIAPHIVDKYTFLLHTADVLPCKNHLSIVPQLVKESMMQRCIAERWERKLIHWQGLLNKASGDWRQLLYESLASNFGFKVNAIAFHQLAISLPLTVLARHKNNLQQLEASLFGQAGLLLGAPQDEYVHALQQEYAFLSKKYQLKPLAAHQWKFMRMRPPNFPTIRIAQFAALLHHSADMFTQIIHERSSEKIKALFAIHASAYWDKHFTLGKETTKATIKHLGEASIDNLLINTIAPIKFLYAHLQGEEYQKEDALQLLQAARAEVNAVTKIFSDAGWKAENAAHTQGQIELYQQYCTPRRCLECAIGLKIIKAQGQ